ncbi:MAG: cytochrome P450 [Thermoplasmatota archaeon]
MAGAWSNLRAFYQDPLAFLDSLRPRGGVVPLRIGAYDFVIVSEPEAVREVFVTKARAFKKGLALERAKKVFGEGLLTAEGDHHRRQRRMIQPLFAHSRIAAYGAVMVEEAERAGARLRDGDIVDVPVAMSRATLTIVGKTLFDLDLEGESTSVGEALQTVLDGFQKRLLPWSTITESLPLPATRRFRRAVDELDRVVFGMIEARRASGSQGNDLLSLMLRAHEGEGAPADGTGMSDREARDEAMTLVLAGHETTAQALTWTFHLLAQNPDAEATLHNEVDDVLADRVPTMADLDHLPYTRQVFAEAMRIFPPVWLIGRRALEDVEIGGVSIAARTLVAPSPWLTHRRGDLWPDPLRFDPERFREGAAERDRFAYYPFGGGPRGCIGEPFAWMEGTLVLATLARRWRFEHAGSAKVDLNPTITLRPAGGLPMRAIARSRATRSIPTPLIGR